MGDLPQGVVTFVFTDIEGSTKLWDEAPEVMMEALGQHDEAVDAAVEAHHGMSVKPRGEGDSRFLVFRDALDAVCAACAIQTNLADVDWVTPRPISVRASVHTGTADLQLGDYYGSAVNRAARLRAIAHGGQTVISGSTWELVRDALPDYVVAKDMGDHALKDLTRPEHVYQLSTDGHPADFPPLASLDAVPNNLPQQVTEFVGRTNELEHAKDLLTKTRLLTILAPGGTGKTRLAIQAAADVTSDYPDGVFFISLAEVQTIGDIVQTIAESIGIAFSADEEPMVQLLSYLGNKTQLLVFDNFEHVVDSAAVISDILRNTSDVSVIVTSRAKLNVQGEAVMPLGGLEITWEDDAAALATSGVRLFLDAAKRADPNFTLETSDLDFLETVLSVTGGMPLGILLAAAWVDVLPLHEIASEITRSLDFLETQMGDVPDRHRSIRAVFDYSWELLTPAEREVFAALSIFRGGFTREAADRVAGATLRDVATLAGTSLITPSATKDRYHVHELLRQFAEAELSEDADKFAEVQQAHADYFTNVATEQTQELFEGDQVAALDVLESDLENFREAWRCSSSQDQPGLARRMLIPLQFLYEIRGWYPAGAALWRRATEAFPEYTGDEDTDVIRALAVAALTYFRTLLGSPDPTAAVEAVSVLRGIGKPHEIFIALQGVALSTSYLGKVDDMITATEEMIAVGEPLAEGMVNVGGYNWRSLAALMSQDFETARELLPRPLEVLRRRDELYYRTWTLALSSMLATHDGDLDQALELLEEQVEITYALGYRRGRMTGLGSLAYAQMTAGRLDDAERTFIEAVEVADEMSIVVEILGWMAAAAQVMQLAGKNAEAVELLASIAAEPQSGGQTISETVSVAERAQVVLDHAKNEMSGEEFETAYARGAATSYETAAKSLIESIR